MLQFIIFFRAEPKTNPPQKYQFPFKSENIELTVIDVGDSYKAILENLHPLLEKVREIAEQTKDIYLAGAVPLGFIWLIRPVLQKGFPHIIFHWLQFSRDKKSPEDTKQYELWEDVKKIYDFQVEKSMKL
jgi:hypothetical protein